MKGDRDLDAMNKAARCLKLTFSYGRAAAGRAAEGLDAENPKRRTGKCLPAPRRMNGLAALGKWSPALRRKR